MDQIIEVLQQGEKDKLMPPRCLLEKSVEPCQSIAEPAGEASSFGQPVVHFPDAVPAADRTRLHDAIVAAVDTEVRPAYRKLANFLATDCVPRAARILEFGQFLMVRRSRSAKRDRPLHCRTRAGFGIQAWAARYSTATSAGAGRIGQPLRCARFTTRF